MSLKDLAARTELALYFGGVDVTDEVRGDLISLNYTDNEEDAADDLQLTFADTDGVWLESYIDSMINSAAKNSSGTQTAQKNESTRYRVKNTGGAVVLSRPAEGYYSYGTLSYGDVIDAGDVVGNYLKFSYSKKTAYVALSALEKLSAASQENITSSGGDGFRISASIISRNARSDGKDSVLDTGVFELDNISYSLPPSTVTLKATALSFTSGVRQTKKSRSWEDYSLKGIATEIAENAGMACMFLLKEDPHYGREEQYAQSDISFLTELCHRAGASVKTSNNIIIIFDGAEFEKKEASRKFVKGDGTYLNFSGKVGKADNTYSDCHVKYIGTDGKLIEGRAYSDNYEASKSGNRTLEISEKVTSVAEATALAQKLLHLYNKFSKTVTLTLIGDTSVAASQTVELCKFGCFDGKYTISRAKHSVSRSGYNTTLELRRII